MGIGPVPSLAKLGGLWQEEHLALNLGVVYWVLMLVWLLQAR